MARKQFVILSFHHRPTMTLILISVVMLLLPFYYTPQFAWSQSQEPAQDNAYTTAKTEHIQVGDINIAYKRFGQGKPILFISGTSQTKDAWEPTLLSQLAATNHTVIVFDNRGIGETTVGTKPFSIEQFANDTAGLLDALQIEKADVFGASLGSFIAQELTLNYPEKVDRLILHATYCGGNEAVYASGQAFESIMTLSSPQILRNMTSEQQAMILAHIMQPTLLIVGDQDLLTPSANSVMMSQRILNSQLVIIEGTGHGAMLQVPNEFTAYIQSFLQTAK